MALGVNPVADNVRFGKRKFGYVENQGQHENLPVQFSIEELREDIIRLGGTADTQYISYLIGAYTSTGPEYHLQDELSVEDGGDPQYKLFWANLKKDGSSHVHLANEETGLTRPLRYEESESNGEGQDVLDSLPRTQWRDSQIDDDYKLYHDKLRVEGSTVIYEYENNPKIVLKDMDLTNLQTENVTSSGKEKSNQSIHFTSSDSSEEESSSPGGSPTRKMRSKFRARIMRKLSEPYDKEEHEELMTLITEQKRQGRHLDLRSGRVIFSTSNKMGKSLLDRHWGLKQKVQAASNDDLKQLNLLRGFFFWLEHLTQEGSFTPWQDNECLAMRPRSNF
ncbi:hypothetical protein M9H77_29558 [Catharanthus roseus]|uniref:Uncharacterized protein n=1 Tax=Catharanthus roseus TaxID=4058 RepID=A0ACB9ZVN4_CATRO|nr:hypothetical protein M9H77_29558 [Catharanthus roseus]